MIESNSIYDLIRQCNFCLCMHSTGTPFCFPMHGQPIVIISAAPSMQAMYKPLYSIRFFRELCLALFGDKCIRNSEQIERMMLEFCADDGCIYWTHYRKCYAPGLEDFSELDSTCADRFLRVELCEMDGSAQHIIVLGADIHEKVEKMTPQALKSKLIFKPFPSQKNLAEFEDIRRLLCQHAKYVSRKMIGFGAKTGIGGYTSNSAALEGNAVHQKFELDAFERMLSGNNDRDDSLTVVENVWYKSLLLPNMRRCGKLIQSYSFIDNQIKVQILDYLSTTGNYTVLRKFKSPASVPNLPDAIRCVNELWRGAFEDYIRFRDPALLCEAENLTSALKSLSFFRNALVHNGGLLTEHGLPSGESTALPGIYSFAGTVYVAAKGEQTLSSLTRKTVELLCLVDKNG